MQEVLKKYQLAQDYYKRREQGVLARTPRPDTSRASPQQGHGHTPSPNRGPSRGAPPTDAEK